MIKVKEEDDKWVEVYGYPVNLNKRYNISLSLSGEEFARFIEFIFSGGVKHSHSLLDKLVSDLTKEF